MTRPAMMVDGLKVWTDRRPFHKGSCHLTTHGPIDALHEFAKRLGLKREWFQDHEYAPHYDLTPAKRQEALRLGAVHVDAVQQARERRARGIGIGPGLKTRSEVLPERCGYHYSHDPVTDKPKGRRCTKLTVEVIYWKDGRFSVGCKRHGVAALTPDARALIDHVTSLKVENG